MDSLQPAPGPRNRAKIPDPLRYSLAVPRLVQSILIATLLTVPLACDKGDDKKAEQKVEVLPKASNGSPVSAKLVEFIGEGEERGMKLELYNHGDKTAASYVFLFRYYDGDDKLLKVKPGTPFEDDTDFTSMSGNPYKVEPGKNATVEIDGILVSVPKDAARAEVLTSRVGAIAADGNTIEDWFSQDSFSDWPEG